MMTDSSSADDTDTLLRRAAEHSTDAVERLFARHRSRLRRMIVARLDDRIARRIDPSDVIQDSLAEAHRLLPGYIEKRPLPFYPWLRQIAVDRLTDLQRHHLATAKRSVTREVRSPLFPTDDSLSGLTARLASREPDPGSHAVRKESRQMVARALNQLPPPDREVLILRHVEALSVNDTAEVLNVPPGTVKSRHYRALQRLKEILRDFETGASE